MNFPAPINGHGTLSGKGRPRPRPASPDREPPQNLDAERSLIGSCLLDAAAIDDAVALGTAPDDFFRAAHGTIWQGILDMQAAGHEVDVVTLKDHLVRKGVFEDVGGWGAIHEIATAVPHAANAKYYAGIVRGKAAGRRLIDACTDMLKRCYSGEYDADTLVCDAQEAILALSDRDAGDATTSYADLMDEVMARMALRQATGLEGIPTGFRDLDAITGGFRPGELTILAARPGMGKSTLGLDFAEAVAGSEAVARSGAAVLFFSVEMGRQPLGDRILTNEAGVDSDRWQRPWLLGADEHNQAVAARNRLRALPIEVDFSPSRTVAQIAAQARRLDRRRGLALAVVDYLQLLNGTRGKNDNREQEVARLSKDLKGLARSLAIPVVTLAQLNRDVEKRADKTPVLSDLRESGSLEQDADVVLLLYRPEYYNPNDRPGVAELIVAKNRNGRTGVVPLTFTANCTRFDSAATEPQNYVATTDAKPF